MLTKMSKLRLIGLESEKSKILDQIFLSKKAHIVKTEQIEGTHLFETSPQKAEIETNLQNTKKTIDALEKLKPSTVKKIECSFGDFLEQEKQINFSMEITEKVCDILDKIAENYNLILKYKASMFELLPVELKKALKFNKLKPETLAKVDEKTKDVLGKIYKQMLKLQSQSQDAEDVEFQNNGENLFLRLNLKQEDYDTLLSEVKSLDKIFETNTLQNGQIELVFSFKNYNPEYYKEYEQKIQTLKEKIEKCEQNNVQNYNLLLGFCEKLDELKLLFDYLSYKLEKLQVEGFLIKTNNTFALTCYVPKQETKSFCEDLEKKFETLVISEQKITPKDEPPTQIKTAKVAKQADFVVNMYSVPRYTDVDPTWSVFLFFMIFFGFIIADVGYGIVLTVLGFVLASKQKEGSGAKRLWKLIGTGGIFAVVWGFLFGSVFGFSNAEWWIIPKGIMPNPQADPIRLLLICLLMGVLQIAYGYLLRGIKLFKQNQVCAGMVNGVAWVMFLLGAILAAAKFLMDFFGLSTSDGFYNVLTAVQFPGLIMMLAGLLVGVLFAGIGTKGFKKFTKSFSALYGLINLFSDILSYARLFGLMLSGAIIAQQFNAIALGVMNGFFGYVFGFLIMLVGHSFNIAMSALSAYIHDVRLQYVEFFGKFYDGDGVMFKPFGANLTFVKIKD